MTHMRHDAIGTDLLPASITGRQEHDRTVLLADMATPDRQMIGAQRLNPLKYVPSFRLSAGLNQLMLVADSGSNR
jgi:hypothetical protein